MDTQQLIAVLCIGNSEEAEQVADHIRASRAEVEAIKAECKPELEFFYREHKAAVERQKGRIQAFEECSERLRGLLAKWCEKNKPPSDVTVTPRWEVEITDPTLVPAEFCTPDLKFIEKHVNSMSGACEIAGVKITPKPTLTVKEHKA